ncbi:MAG: hypothetical protein GY796_03825 [Chloroflexi bacterium]|nr:hypothetical protein [Chloroflexota bacterium]
MGIGLWSLRDRSVQWKPALVFMSGGDSVFHIMTVLYLPAYDPTAGDAVKVMRGSSENGCISEDGRNKGI